MNQKAKRTLPFHLSSLQASSTSLFKPSKIDITDQFNPLQVIRNSLFTSAPFIQYTQKSLIQQTMFINNPFWTLSSL